tara:strand:- start:225 stop:809 length:585 start_codon:yes stop_codon:yes gene_type:complete
MGLGSYLLNPLPLSIVFNSYVALFTPLIIYFFLYRNPVINQVTKVPSFIKEMVIVLIIGWLSSSWLAMYSTLDQCGSFSISWTLLIGLITPAFMLLGLLLVKYLIPFLAIPAKVLFAWIKNPFIQDAMITGFYMMLFSWMGSIITHFKATDEGCLRSSKDMKQFRADMKKRQEEMELEAEQDDNENDEPEMVSM